MSIDNVSLQMQKKFEILDEMIKNGYIKPIKPSFSWLPSLCFYPNKTAKFNNAPQELKQQFIFSWYAFFLAPFAFAQTRLAKDYSIMVLIILTIISFLPPGLSYITEIAFSVVISQVFVCTRYYQYKTYGRCPSNRNIFSTICLGLIIRVLIQIPSIIISILLYRNSN